MKAIAQKQIAAVSLALPTLLSLNLLADYSGSPTTAVDGAPQFAAGGDIQGQTATVWARYSGSVANIGWHVTHYSDYQDDVQNTVSWQDFGNETTSYIFKSISTHKQANADEAIRATMSGPGDDFSSSLWIST